jgi:hypothetical protein
MEMVLFDKTCQLISLFALKEQKQILPLAFCIIFHSSLQSVYFWALLCLCAWDLSAH